MSKVADILERAAELIDENGWCQGQRVNQRGERCVQGGLQRAADEVPRSWAEGARAVAALQRFLGVNPAAWNDARERTKGEVLDALRKCAARERARVR